MSQSKSETSNTKCQDLADKWLDINQLEFQNEKKNKKNIGDSRRSIYENKHENCLI